MFSKTRQDMLHVITVIGLLVVAITFLTAVSLGPAIGNIFMSSPQADILLPQEQQDLDAAQAQLSHMSPVLGMDMLISVVVAEIGILALVLTALYAHFRGRMIIGGLLLSGVCAIIVLRIAMSAQRMMTTAAAIRVYPLTGNPWDTNKLIDAVQGFASSAKSIAVMSMGPGVVLLGLTVLSFFFIRYSLRKHDATVT